MTITPTLQRPVFEAPVSDWKRAVFFMLTLSLLGLSFYPAFIIILILMINSWNRDRYHFLIQTFMLCGGYGVVTNSMFPIHLSDILLFVSFLSIFIVRKDRLTWKAVFLSIAYMGVLLILAIFSVESLTVQIRGIRNYMMIMTFLIPLLVFSGEGFEMKRFFQVVIVYSLILCVYYIFDGFIFNGWILLPKTHVWSLGVSTFWHPILHPFTTYFPRKYPPGLYWLALCVFPLIYVYRFSWKQWCLVGLAFMSSRTMSVIFGLLASYLLFQKQVRKVIIYVAVGIVAIAGLYVVDSATGGFMRISSTLDQFVTLDAAQDREDLAEFGSTRMAQAIPKIEMLYDQHKEWTGFGFIHEELSKNSAVQLTNDLYSDIEKSDENVAAIEVTQLHTFLMAGFIGLIAQFAFYIGLFFVLKPTGYAKYYLSVFFAFSVFGIGGFGGLTQDLTLLLLGLTVGVILLNYRRNGRLTERVSEQHESVPTPV